MNSRLPLFVLLAVVPSLLSGVTAFVQPSGWSSASSLSMAPRYDPTSQRWSPSNEEEAAAASYGALRSLLRHGPKAFFVRTTQPDQYDQAVLKFMAREQCSRWEAQGNMDRFFENAQDWAYERLEAERMGRKMDYVSLDQKQVVLSSVWAGIVFWFSNYLFNIVVEGGYLSFK